MNLSRLGAVLRSGGAEGADSAFERGCDSVGGIKEIYLPWQGFNGNPSVNHGVCKRATEIAERFHPHWQKLTRGGRLLQARNSYQILGKDLDSPVDFVVCWAQGGSGKGGTGQAIRIAKHEGIPVYDLGYGLHVMRDLSEKVLENRK